MGDTSMRFPMIVFMAGLLSLTVAATVVKPAAAEEPTTRREQVNKGTVSIISGGINGTYIRVATDLASVLDDGEKLRVLPIMGKGSVQNIDDILFLRGIDIGIVQSDVFQFIKKNNKYSNIDSYLRYITKLYNEEFHLLAGPGINTLDDLKGKKVNFGVEGSGTYMTASLVFDILGIESEPTAFDQGLALEKIKSGEIAATVYVAGKPVQLLQNISSEDGFRLLEVPPTPELLEVYLPARFTPEDYPAMIATDQQVKTIAVSAVMAVYNWKTTSDRYEKVANFIESFFQNFDAFKNPPRHPKWREVSLTAEVPGWVRYGTAQDWLKHSATGGSGKLRTSFEDFLEEQAPTLADQFTTAEQKEQLFRLFIEWENRQAD
jgi:TRAP transporter TAXI family solute receptor